MRKAPKFEDEIEEYLNLDSKSEATKLAYGVAFRLFLKYYKAKYGETANFGHFLDRVFEEFKNPVRDQKHIAEKELMEFIKCLQIEGKSNNSIRLYFAALQNFLKYKQVTVSMSFIKIPAAHEKKENGKHEWELGQIKEFVNTATTYRDKAIILCMLQSGLAVNEICELNYGDIQSELETGKLPLCLKLIRQKTDVEFKTFFGRDAVHYLKLYLETRGKLKPTDPLFAKERLKGGEPRLTPTIIEQTFNKIAEKTSFIKLAKDAYNPARPHSLRAAFNSLLIGTGVDEKLREFWMGHCIGTDAKAYLQMPTEKMRKLYATAEEYLKIDKSSHEEQEEIAKGKSAFSDVLEADVKALKAKVESLELMYNKLFEVSPEELRELMQEISKRKFAKQHEEDKNQLKKS